MTLKEYLYLTGIKFKDFAERLDVDVSTFSRYINGKLPYSERVAVRIEWITNGAIKAADLLKEGRKNEQH